jgi:proline dehydrogenase
VNVLRPLLTAAVAVTPPQIVRALGRPYIAGADREDALAAARGLAERGALVTVDHLGEGRIDDGTADATLDEYERLLEQLGAEVPGGGVSVKLSALGQLVSEERSLRRLERLADAAADHGRFVRVDMEDASLTDSTLDLYRRLRASGRANVGVVLQACLRRSPADAASLVREGIADVRVCKGIYVEPYAIAHRDRELIRESFAELVDLVLAGGGRVAVATHDDRLVEAAARSARRHDPARERHEYQTLLGVRPELISMLAGRCDRVRVYVPYGRDAERYATRRVQENPRIAMQVVGAAARRALALRGGSA